MTTPTCDLVFVIDESGSMMSIKMDAIGGVNQVLEEQRALPGECAVTIALFNTVTKRICTRIPISQVQPLTAETFRPSGMTALYDAMGKTLGEARQFEGPANPDHKRIAVIVTDGAENSSREWTNESVKKLTDELKAAGWEFVYTGANQDAFAVASSMGIANAHTATYAATAEGTRSAYRGVNASVTSMRMGGSAWDPTKASEPQAQSAPAPADANGSTAAWPGPTDSNL